MKAVVVIDGHLGKTPDGKIWSQRIYDYNFFKRYLQVFEKVRIVSRIKNIENNNDFPLLCSGENVDFFQIKDYRGPKEYLLNYFEINKNIDNAFEGCDCGIFRIPSNTGYKFVKKFKKTKKPYAVEVVVDPWDTFSYNKSILNQLIRIIWTYDLKKICKIANGVSYVTKNALQERYPSYARIKGENKQHFESYYSSVKISKEYFNNEFVYRESNRLKIIHVSNMIASYGKGHKELIEAASILNRKGIKLDIEFIGQGNLIDEFKEYAKKLKVDDEVNFIGALASSNDVREHLINSDMFVFPSHAEGLPRVLIEAMAVGLPCISSNINGIPELLDNKYLIKVGDSVDLANKIELFIKNKELRENEGRRNILVAKQYSEEKLQKKRNDFYKKLRNITKNNTI